MNVSRSNQETLDYYRQKIYYTEEEKKKLAPDQSKTPKTKALKVTCSSQDLIFQLIHIGLCFSGKTPIKTQIGDKIISILGKICQGRRYLRCHLELVFQYIKSVINKIFKRVGGFEGLKNKLSFDDDPQVEFEGYDKMNYCLKMLQQIITRRREMGP